MTATFRDINGDGAPDFYVCNDFWTPDRIWINNGRGQFRALREFNGGRFCGHQSRWHLDFYVLDMLSRDHRLRRRQMLAQVQR